jgi:hypothetical protein
MKLGSRLAIALFSLVAVIHLLRLVFAIPVSIGSTVIPMWPSVLATIVPAAVAFMLWRERGAGGGPPA